MKPFWYPQERHRRSADPGPFASYRTYKPYLRVEFEGACVYCRVRDSMKREALFAVEHYRPQKAFPNLVTEWSNLYYACSTCNGAKLDFVSRGSKARINFIPHPCDHVMREHLRYRGAVVLAHSATGTFAIDLLDLNAPTSVDYREFYARLLEDALAKLAYCRKLVEVIKAAITTASSADRLGVLEAGLQKAEATRKKAEQHARYIVGPFGQLPT